MAEHELMFCALCYISSLAYSYTCTTCILAFVGGDTLEMLLSMHLHVCTCMSILLLIFSSLAYSYTCIYISVPSFISEYAYPHCFLLWYESVTNYVIYKTPYLYIPTFVCVRVGFI